MFKRVRWIGIGAVAGAGATLWAQRRVREEIDRYLPAQLRAAVAARFRGAGVDIREALHEGRAAMADREAELRSQLADRSPEGRRPGAGAGGDSRPGRPVLSVVGGLSSATGRVPGPAHTAGRDGGPAGPP